MRGDASRRRLGAVAELRGGAVDREVERTADVHLRAGERPTRADDERVRGPVGAERVERLRRGYPDSAPLARGEAPDAVVAAELSALLVDDRSLGALEPLPLEEGAIVVAGEEARLLALAALGDLETGGGRLGPRLRLRLSAEGELDPIEHLRVERREHVRLVLVRIRAPREQAAAVALDDPCVVTGPERRCTGTVREGEKLVEAEAAVAAPAGIRRLATCVPLHERLDDGGPELLAQVERHVRDAERMAGLTRGDHRLRRAAGALGVRPGGIEPEPQRDPDRLRPRPQQRDRAVDAAAHRDRDPARVGLGTEDLAERVRERVGGEGLTRDRGGLEQREPVERALEPGRVGGDDPVAVDREPHERELFAACGVSEHLEHVVQPSGGSVDSPRSTLCVALRVNVNQRHVKGSLRPALSRHGTHLVSQVRIGARNIGRVERLRCS